MFSDAITNKNPLKSPEEVLGSDFHFLRKKVSPAADPSAQKNINIVDLFCGVGGLSLGLYLAAAHLNTKIKTSLALDLDEDAIACYRKNFVNANALTESIESVFSADLDSPLTKTETTLKEQVGTVDILVGGPPCQGHSDLNNFTRRNDPKNMLYLFMARAAKVFSPKTIIIENVVGSLHDKSGVVTTVVSYLKNLGYNVDFDLIDFSKIGVPQNRKRLVIKAALFKHRTIKEIIASSLLPKRDLAWAIKDIEYEFPTSIFNSPSKPTRITVERIKYLFDNNLYNLPDSQRPACHRNKKHSYDSVYGRLSWNKLSPTITSGFFCMCMGRYVHPTSQRTLTAHEAARIQFFPDFFDFSPVRSKTKLAILIGNAVPSKGAYLLGFDLISSLIQSHEVC